MQMDIFDWDSVICFTCFNLGIPHMAKSRTMGQIKKTRFVLGESKSIGWESLMIRHQFVKIIILINCYLVSIVLLLALELVL